MRKLAVGSYKTTRNFQAVPEHTAVMYADDCGLVATTGLAHDLESRQYALLFAAAPELLAACEIAEAVLTDIFERESKTSAHGQRVRADIESNLGYIQAAIAKARRGDVQNTPVD